MSRLHAYIKDYVVVKIKEIDEDQYFLDLPAYDTIVDVHDYSIAPEIGWKMVGGKILPDDSQSPSPLESMVYQQTHQRLFGQKLLIQATDRVGIYHFYLASIGQSVDLAAFGSAMIGLKTLLEGGALKTARGMLIQTKIAMPGYAEIFDWVIAEISNFLAANSYE